MPPEDYIKVYVVDYGRKYFGMRWVDPVTRKMKFRSSGCTRRRDAERVAGELEAKLNASRATGDGTMQWEAFLDLYQHRQLAGMDAPTEKWHLAKLHVFAEAQKPKTLGAITATFLSQYVAWLRGQGRMDSTIRGHMIALRCALEWAHDQGYTAEVPKIPTVKLPRGGKPRGRALEFWEFIKMLRAVADVVQPSQVASWRHLLLGLWLSGLRIAEAAELSWDDPTAPRISFREKYPTLEMDVEDDKGREHRLLPITPDFARWLARTPKDQRTGRIFRPLGQEGQVITNESNLSRTISEFGEKANIIVNHRQRKFASAHDLRRTYGTRWAPKVHILLLKDLMRHQSIETTQKYYLGLKAQSMAETLWNQVTRKVTPPDQDSKSA